MGRDGNGDGDGIGSEIIKIIKGPGGEKSKKDSISPLARKTCGGNWQEEATPSSKTAGSMELKGRRIHYLRQTRLMRKREVPVAGTVKGPTAEESSPGFTGGGWP